MCLIRRLCGKHGVKVGIILCDDGGTRLYEFGLRYYDAFCTVEDNNKIFPDMPDMDFANRTEL